jgi:toxin secretion/phage lysis holin
MKLLRIDHLGFALIGGLMAWWATVPMIVQALVMLTVLDFLSGWGKSIVNRRLSSFMSWQGTARKGLTFLLVAAGWVAHAKLGLPVALHEILAGFFAASELLSILENCQEAGIHLPADIMKYFKPLEGRYSHARDNRHRTEDSE